MFLERVKKKTRAQQIAEKQWNAYTHGIALVVAIPMTYFLLARATRSLEYISKETKLLFSHTVWHILVLLGSMAMYMCIYLYV